jgi:hypothetical protein
MRTTKWLKIWLKTLKKRTNQRSIWRSRASMRLESKLSTNSSYCKTNRRSSTIKSGLNLNKLKRNPSRLSLRVLKKCALLFCSLLRKPAYTEKPCKINTQSVSMISKISLRSTSVSMKDIWTKLRIHFKVWRNAWRNGSSLFVNHRKLIKPGCLLLTPNWTKMRLLIGKSLRTIVIILRNYVSH